MREKFEFQEIYSEVKIEENKIVAFNRKCVKQQSFRVQKDGVLGVHFQMGEMSDEEGFRKAEENLALGRPYPYELETGERHRDKTERVYTDKELMEFAQEALAHLCEKYPKFRFSGNFCQWNNGTTQWNDKGLSYSSRDCNVNANINYKHVDSKDLSDGGFYPGMRTYDKQVLFDMADNYLGNFENRVELPEEGIVQMQYYGFLGKLVESLDAEQLALGSSLLTGKLGTQVFSEAFTLIDDTSDEECWHTHFFDGEGCVKEGDRRVFIDHGVPLLGYADKRIAAKYGVPHTGNAWRNYSDIPGNGNVNMRIARSEKTIKELLNGRLSVIPVMYSGGGFNDKGDYVMPVHRAFLCDGEKILGNLPPFTMSSNMFDMFGKDFIGVGSDNPVFNDKSILVKMKLS